MVKIVRLVGSDINFILRYQFFTLKIHSFNMGCAARTAYGLETESKEGDVRDRQQECSRPDKGGGE